MDRDTWNILAGITGFLLLLVASIAVNTPMALFGLVNLRLGKVI